jgi:hypothetical protein
MGKDLRTPTGGVGRSPFAGERGKSKIRGYYLGGVSICEFFDALRGS